ncbi:histidine kinase [Nonomuraea sp. NPDC050786]|uniref:sensor histidine kinase n=1 Tax=Nonomuraea sp. NPDC050786 TaxID=3154840 RepID=UPI0033EF2A75
MRKKLPRRWACLVLGGALLMPYMMAGVVVSAPWQEQHANLLLPIQIGVFVAVLPVVAVTGLFLPVRGLAVNAAQGLLGAHVETPPRQAGRSWQERRRTAAWFTLHLAIGGLVSGCTLAIVPFTLATLALPFAWRAMPALGIVVEPGWPVVLWMAGGLALLVALAAVAAGAGELLARLAPVLLGPTPAERLAAAEEHARTLAERNRLARELHDSVGHALSVVTLQAAAAGRVLDRDPQTARTALAAIEGSARAALEDLDHVLGLLRDDTPANGYPADQDSVNDSLAGQDPPNDSRTGQDPPAVPRNNRDAADIGQGDRDARSVGLPGRDVGGTAHGQRDTDSVPHGDNGAGKTTQGDHDARSPARGDRDADGTAQGDGDGRGVGLPGSDVAGDPGGARRASPPGKTPGGARRASLPGKTPGGAHRASPPVRTAAVARRDPDPAGRARRGPDGHDARQRARAPRATLADLDELVATSGAQVRQEVGDLSAVPAVVSREAYRIVQEALTNAIKHGRDPVHLTATVHGDDLRLEITNPGGGNGAHSGGRGVTGMRERVRLLRGELESGPTETGWKVSVRLPLRSSP